MEVTVDSGGLRLSAYLAQPPASSGGPGTVRHGLVVCHGLPSGPGGAATTARTYPNLAARVAADAGWVVLSINQRGTGRSEGNFSLGGWMEDIRAAVGHLLRVSTVDRVFLAGFGVGGSLAICEAGEDERVGGVAAFSAPADFEPWAADPRRLLDHARAVGMVTDRAFPPDPDGWARELRDIKPLSLVAKVPPRPVLLVHGNDDAEVSVMDARALADAADGDVELRVLSGAGNRLRHDPRAVAVLIGWLDRQG